MRTLPPSPLGEGRGEGGAYTPAERIWRVFSLIRYRFFLFAGLLPYLLGAAWAWAYTPRFDATLFWMGLGGVALSVIGVEAFNEYFDAREGTDRIFNPADVPPIAKAVFWIGVVAFTAAFAVGAYLAWRAGWPILVFALLGGAAAIFYEAPPIRWVYRGLGETMIGLAYGPWMVLGSVYLHLQELPLPLAWASLVPALLIAALAVVNAIPDFHQDRLVGKRNLVQRVGRDRAVALYVGLAGTGLAIIPAGVALRAFPAASLLALLALPWLVASARHARATFTAPKQFLPAMRHMVIAYLVASSLLVAGFLSARWT